MDILTKGLCQRIKAIRVQRGLKQSTFASMLGVSSTKVSFWENDKRDPNVKEIAKIVLLFGVNPYWLLLGYPQEYKKELDWVETLEVEVKRHGQAEVKRHGQAEVKRHGQAEVARRLNLAEPTISLVLSGKYPASTKNIEKKVDV